MLDTLVLACQMDRSRNTTDILVFSKFQIMIHRTDHNPQLIAAMRQCPKLSLQQLEARKLSDWPSSIGSPQQQQLFPRVFRLMSVDICGFLFCNSLPSNTLPANSLNSPPPTNTAHDLGLSSTGPCGLQFHSAVGLFGNLSNLASGVLGVFESPASPLSATLILALLL